MLPKTSPTSPEQSPAKSLSRITPLRRKVEKVLSIEIDANVGTALNNLSSFYGENTAANRQSLRDDIEVRCVEVHKELLSKYSEIQKSLDAVERDVKNLKIHCDNMESRLEKTLQDSGSLVKRAEILNQNKKKNDAQQEVISEFMKHFQLTEEEVKILKVKNIDNIAFFDVLKKVRTIQQNCKLLLEAQDQNAGMEIMEKMSEYLESANKLLYWWVKNECRALDSDSPEISNLLVEAFYALSERPVLLSYCLQEIGDTRNKAIKLNFMIALTKGGDGTRPIEIHTHDPYRYVSDMAAWIHQSLASESELIFSLLRKTNKDENVGGKKKYTEQISQILNRCLTDVAAPFNARFLQALSLKPKMLLVLKLAYLVDFYQRNFLQLLGPGAVLTRTFAECKADAMKVFFALAQKKNNALSESPPIPTNDLSIPHEINEIIARVKEIFVILSSSLCSDEEKVNETATILEYFIPPLFQLCEKSSLALGKLEKLLYTLNILITLREAVGQGGIVTPQVEQVDEKIKNNVNELTIIIQTLKEKRSEEKSKNIIPKNSIERMAEKKLIRMAKDLMTRAK